MLINSRVSIIAIKLIFLTNAHFLVDSTIRANYANFGFIPYGQTIMGKLHYSDTLKYACEEFEEGTELKRADDVSPFMIARRG